MGRALGDSIGAIAANNDRGAHRGAVERGNDGADAVRGFVGCGASAPQGCGMSYPLLPEIATLYVIIALGGIPQISLERRLLKIGEDVSLLNARPSQDFFSGIDHNVQFGILPVI